MTAPRSSSHQLGTTLEPVALVACAYPVGGLGVGHPLSHHHQSRRGLGHWEVVVPSNPWPLVARNGVLAVVAPVALRHQAGNYTGEVVGLALGRLTSEHLAAFVT